MSETIVEVRHAPARAAKQSIVLLVCLAVGVAMAWFSIWLVTTGGALIVVIGIVLAILGLLGVAICLMVLWGNVKVLTGRADPALAVDGEAWHWQGVTVPWSHVAGVVVEVDRSVSLAFGADAALERGVERAMAAGGVNDGTRNIVLHTRDRVATAAALGKAAYLVHDGPQPGTGSLRIVLDAATDPADFAQAISALAAEANRRGVAIQTVTG